MMKDKEKLESRIFTRPRAVFLKHTIRVPILTYLSRQGERDAPLSMHNMKYTALVHTLELLPDYKSVDGMAVRVQ